MQKTSKTAKEIFDNVVEIESPDERAAHLDEACAEDAELRQQVEGLIRAYERAGDFLESPPAGLDATLDAPQISERPGMMIGRYKLLEQIGEGGFGVVFMAEQREPFQRKVALKIIKPGMDTKEVVARFEAERQALALMDHPNIAHVLDGGTTESGRPYFVMELVRGIPITEFCDKNQLTTEERLEMFMTVCKAVEHAHEKGVVHRDIKPTNVLVTLHDGEPVVKVIDFGVAKALNQRLTDKTLFTQFMQMIGTPLYMSPEQAEMSGLDVDRRSDIYSLGVLLYELLTGTTPLDKQRMRTAARDEIRRIIREEDPPKPSTRLSSLGKALSSVSAQRKTAPENLTKLVHGDLDWIVMKSLEKDRHRRYESAQEFAQDLNRHLSDEPVAARPPSHVYRMKKFVRRNKRAVIAASLLASVALLAVLVAFLLGTMPPPDPTERVSERPEQPHSDVDPHEEIVRLLEVADSKFCTKKYQQAETLYRRAFELQERYFGEDDRRTLITKRRIAECLIWQGRFRDAIPLYLTTYEAQLRLFGTDDPEAKKTYEQLEKSTFGWVSQLRRKKQFDEADEHYRFCVACAEKHGNWQLSARIHEKVGWLHSLAWDYERAWQAFEQAIEINRKHLSKDGREFGLALYANAWIARELGDEQTYREYYKRYHDSISRVQGKEAKDTQFRLLLLAASYVSSRQFGEAAKLYKDLTNETTDAIEAGTATEYFEGRRDAEAGIVWYCLFRAADSEHIYEEHQQWIELARQYAVTDQRQRGALQVKIDEFLGNWAAVASRYKVSYVWPVSDLERGTHAGRLSFLRWADERMTRALTELARFGELEKQLEYRVNERTELLPEWHPGIAYVRLLYAQVLRQQGEPDEARVQLDEAHKILAAFKLTPKARLEELLDEMIALYDEQGYDGAEALRQELQQITDQSDN